MIEQPPRLCMENLQDAMFQMSRSDIQEIINDANDNYLYWSDVKYKKKPDDVSYEQLWSIIKLSRISLRIFTWSKYKITVPITNRMQRLCHDFDMNFGGSWGNNSVIPSEDKERFLISSLMEEAISSSQMEGAATTRKVAKDMLRKKLSPKGRSEQMIYNNYACIQFVTDHKDDDMTPELLLHVHSLMTQKTLDSEEDEGRFRTNDDVVVENSINHEVVHTPPSYLDIPLFIMELCDFMNKDDHGPFIHPIVKAVVVHFMVAYMHPFVDGNGRTARALFYWYMLKKGYWLTEYLSISRIIYKSKAQYEKSYLYVEADERDMGYFINYHLRVLDIAFKELKMYIEKKILNKQRNNDIYRIGGLNERQMELLSLLRNNPQAILTVKEIEIRFGVSHPTAKLDMDGLVERGFIYKVPVNKVKFNYLRSDDFDELISKKS